ncbi:YoaK family protein [Mycobacteroides salmoniphilum]|uniref:YoaK family protein n=1 Tax=Mycobacteroides salmoniphilum TaxID=404941 RepID=UPI0009943441|nr:YoaK family protein [Mycobacteroides salmoniphilum]
MNKKSGSGSAAVQNRSQDDIELDNPNGDAAASTSADAVITREAAIGGEARLSWLLSGLAGMVGAVAFLHSAGYFVTFMTGNTERAVLTWFKVTDKQQVAGAGPIAAISMIGAFLFGVIVASYCRRKFWNNHPHGATVLTTFGLLAAAAVDFFQDRGFNANVDVHFTPILLLAFAIGALNTSFVKKGETAIPLSYVTGTVVKLGQGIERHLFGKGSVFEWLGYAMLYLSFILGAAIGGGIASLYSGSKVILTVGLICGATTLITFFHSDRKTILG